MQGSIIPTTVDSARGLRFSSGTVSCSAANSPISGQALIATSSTTAIWQTVSAVGGVGSFTGLGITGNPTTYLTGAVALIASGNIQLAYSGNNIVIGGTNSATSSVSTVSGISAAANPSQSGLIVISGANGIFVSQSSITSGTNIIVSGTSPQGGVTGIGVNPNTPLFTGGFIISGSGSVTPYIVNLGNGISGIVLSGTQSTITTITNNIGVTGFGIQSGAILFTGGVIVSGQNGIVTYLSNLGNNISGIVISGTSPLGTVTGFAAATNTPKTGLAVFSGAGTITVTQSILTSGTNIIISGDASAASNFGGVSGIGITGLTLLSGNVSFIPSGAIQLFYSGNNIVIGNSGSNAGVTSLSITGQSAISGAIAFIASGSSVIAYSGNNIVIGCSATNTTNNNTIVSTGEPLKSDVISIASGIQTIQVSYGYTYTGIPSVVGIVNNTGSNVSGFVAHIPVTFVNQTQSGALAVLASSAPSGNYTLNYSLIPSNSNSVNGSATLLDPRNISNCVLWLDAAVAVFSDSGITSAVNDGFVGQWNDLSSSENHARQTISGARPRYVASGENFLPTISFTGTNTFLSINDNSGLSPVYLTAFAVAAKTGVTGPILRKGDGTVYELSFSNNSNADAIMRTTTAHSVGGYGAIFGKTSVLAGKLSRVILKVYINGSGNSANPTTYSGNYGGAGNLNIGGPSGAASDFLQGRISEIILYNRALPELDIMRVNDYLSQKYTIY